MARSRQKQFFRGHGSGLAVHERGHVLRASPVALFVTFVQISSIAGYALYSPPVLTNATEDMSIY